MLQICYILKMGRCTQVRNLGGAPCKYFAPMEKCVGHCSKLLDIQFSLNLSHFQKTLCLSWYPKLVTGLGAHENIFRACNRFAHAIVATRIKKCIFCTNICICPDRFEFSKYFVFLQVPVAPPMAYDPETDKDQLTCLHL